LLIFGIFRYFGAFWAPWALPGTPSEGLFYINPSRRGPAPGSGDSRRPGVPEGRGNPPKGVQGAPPWAEA